MRMVSGIAWNEQWDDHNDATAMLFAAPDTAAFVGAHAQAQAPGLALAVQQRQLPAAAAHAAVRPAYDL